MNEFSVRAMREADIEAAMLLKDAEGWNQTESDWRFMLTHSPGLCFVACIDGNVIGTVTALNYNNEVAWISMMLVSRQHRGRGISTRLLETVISGLRSCVSIKLDATPAGNPVYAKMGFNEELKLLRMEVRELKAPRVEPYPGEVTSISDADISEVVEYEKGVFGTSREKLIHFLIEHRSEHCVVTRREGRIVGLATLRRGTFFHHLGPVFCETLEDAKAVICELVGGLIGTSVVMDVLSDKPMLLDWLHEMGFSSQRPLYRMYLGDNRFPGRIACQFAIAGPELG